MASDRLGMILERLERIERSLVRLERVVKRRRVSRKRDLTDGELELEAKMLFDYIMEKGARLKHRNAMPATRIKEMMKIRGVATHASAIRAAMPYRFALKVARDKAFGGRWSWSYDTLAIRRAQEGVAQPVDDILTPAERRAMNH